jgi:ABC-type uncharacterized transport system permease subunit
MKWACAVVSVVGAILLPIGIACVRLGDRDRFMPVVVAGWLAVLTGMLLFAVPGQIRAARKHLAVLTGMLLFAVIVYRSSGRAPARPLNNLERPAPSAERCDNFIFPSPVGK